LSGTKVAVALYFYRLATMGGAERMVCLLANALVTRGFVVHLVSWDQPGAEPFYDVSPEVKLHCLGFRPGVAGKIQRSRALYKLLRENGVRVLVGFVMSGDRTVLGAAKLAGTKVIAAERNAPEMYDIRHGSKRWLNFSALHLVDRIAIQLPDFVEGYPATLRGRIETIPNPVAKASSRARPEQPGPKGRFTLLAVSRLDRVQKRLHTLTEAFALIAPAHPDWDLLIVGDGPEKDALGRVAKDRGIAKRVRIEASAADISRTYAAAHLFVIPSRWEGFSNALAEALSHGLPAVGFRGAPGVAQLIADGETGWLADGADDANSLATVLDQAMADGPERGRLGANAVVRMEVYAPEAQFDRWANLIRAIAGES
jgi:GalNAc-alpha-(1->4)-GalNAc-alpha-(1->3)-diNAcBac-PP-undecaprenol alpha-1,4-N-acetyl-D-galactosaminyltransferase